MNITSQFVHRIITHWFDARTLLHSLYTELSYIGLTLELCFVTAERKQVHLTVLLQNISLYML